jgi:chitodextrinase
VVAVALVALLGSAGGFLLVSYLSKPAVPPLRPAGLLAAEKTDNSVTLRWAARSAGSVPATYEILKNGKEIASVPGTQTSYRVTGLSSYTAYQFNVKAVTGTLRSPSSAALLMTTAPPPAPPLSDAVFSFTGWAGETETAASDDYWHRVGATWQDQWTVIPTCGFKKCATAVLDGSIDGVDFTTTLHRSGTTYTGGAPLNKFWYACATNNFTPSNLSIKLTVTSEGFQSGTYNVTAFKGTVVWNIPFDGCVTSTYTMKVNGSVPGTTA